MKVKLPDKLDFLFEPARYHVLYGGRDSGKTTNTIIALLIKGRQKPLRILCCREFQVSIKQSVHSALKKWIGRCNLNWFYNVTDKTITGLNGTEFMFQGIKNNTENIKSFDNVNICYVEEANKISQSSWDILIPTIREEGSEFFIVFNPEQESDPVYNMFVKNKRPDSIVRLINYYDNPFLTEASKKEIEYLKNHDFKKYLHVYEGNLLDRSQSAVFNNWKIESIDDLQGWTTVYGMDFGFAQDPQALVKVNVNIDKRILYIDQEAYKVNLEIDDYIDFIKTVDGAWENYITADCARPEAISHLNRHGGHIIKSIKGPGSVLEGVNFIKNFKIIINPDCKNSIYEFTNYSHKVEKLTGLIKPTEFEDKNNHCIDAIRYSLERIRRQGIFK